MRLNVLLGAALVAASAQAIARTGPGPLIQWQRTLEDAEALSKATGKPMLVCVNMDDESACEVFARQKYKDVAFADLMAGFVPVIASPVRHNPLDHDQAGRRIPCPRFGEVTCQEHMAIEAPVYQRFFGGQRYAPRHVGVSVEGEVLFDRYLDSDLTRVDDALREHGIAGSLPAGNEAEGQRVARVRATLEAEYVAADRDGRRVLLEDSQSASQPGVLRLGMYETDTELRALATSALAGSTSGTDVDLTLRALSFEGDPARRAQLMSRIAGRAERDPRVAKQVKVSDALSAAPLVDVERWRLIFHNGDADGGLIGESWDLEAQLETLLEVQQVDGEDGPRLLRIAQCYLDLARWRMAEGQGPGYFLTDADAAAQRAQELGVDEIQAAAVQSQVAWFQFRQEEAGDLALSALTGLSDKGQARTAFELLSVLAAARTRSIQAQATDWPEHWVSEALAAYRVVEQHPHSTAAQWVAHVDLLNDLMLSAERDQVLERGLERFPAEPELHGRLRSAILERRGAGELEVAYMERRDGTSDPAGHDWFTGYATLVLAEDHRRVKRWDEAQAAYERAKEHFARSAAGNADYEASCMHFRSMALAGQAQAALMDRQMETAVMRIFEAVRLRPDSVDVQDGLQRTPLEVLTAVLRAVRAPGVGHRDLLARLTSLERSAPQVWQRVN
ncbi:MAG: hypothetical protein ACI8QZ_002129 [Chlamydiales bacterium]|jgi:hypothetical protein